MNKPPIDWRMVIACAIIALFLATFWSVVIIAALVVLSAVPVLW